MTISAAVHTPLRQTALADEFRKGLATYHQLDGEQNGSHTDGVQLPPGFSGDEKALKQELARFATFLSGQSGIDLRATPSKNPERAEARKEIAAGAAAWVKAASRQALDSAVDAIANPALKALVATGLTRVPEEFFAAPSSSSGKYHPADEINEGGLALHTARVVAMADKIMEYPGFSSTPLEKDIVKAALVLHDTQKGGIPWNGYAADHGHLAGQFIATLPGGNTSEGRIAQRLASNHMAQWNAPRSTPPADKLEQIVSYADYLASLDQVYVRVPGQP